MSAASPKQKKGWRRAPPTLLLLPALPKHSITDAVLQLHQVFPTAQVFQPTETHTENAANEVPVSLLSPRLLWKPELRSCLPDTLPQRAFSWASILNLHSLPAHAAVFPKKSHFPLGSPWLLKLTGRGTVVPCLSSAQQRHSPAALLPAPLQSPLPARLSVTSVQQYPTDDAAEVQDFH